MVEYFPLRRIEQIFRFCYHWRAIDTALVHLVELNRSQQNHSHLMISFSNHHHLYYFVHTSSIKASMRTAVSGGRVPASQISAKRPQWEAGMGLHILRKKSGPPSPHQLTFPSFLYPFHIEPESSAGCWGLPHGLDFCTSGAGQSHPGMGGEGGHPPPPCWGLLRI